MKHETVCQVMKQCDVNLTSLNVGLLQGKAWRALPCRPDTTPAYPHLTSNVQQPKNETTNVVMNIIVASSWWWAL